MNIMKKDTFYICGYAVETTASQNQKDVSALYADFFSSGKDTVLFSLAGSKKGYYGLNWYTKGHERYCYLLGIEVNKENAAPQNALLKEVPETTYAMVHYPKEKDIIEAWTEFFYTEIPQAGFKPNEEQNLYFEYYPDSVHGEFELWVPVVKADV